jgi:hypothetical protein
MFFRYYLSNINKGGSLQTMHNTEVAIATAIAIVAQLKYTINLAWINHKRNDDQKYIFPDTGPRDEDSINCNDNENRSKHKCIVDNIKGWAQKNPNAIIYLWYLPEFTTEKAIQNTQELMSSISTNIQLKSYRSIDIKLLGKTFVGPQIYTHSDYTNSVLLPEMPDDITNPRLQLPELKQAMDELLHELQDPFSLYDKDGEIIYVKTKIGDIDAAIQYGWIWMGLLAHSRICIYVRNKPN